VPSFTSPSPQHQCSSAGPQLALISTLTTTKTDFSSLSWLELKWAAWYIWHLVGKRQARHRCHGRGNPTSKSQLASLKPSSKLKIFLVAGVFRSMRTVDHHRRHPLLQKMETSARQNTDTKGTMGLHKTRPRLSFRDGTPYGRSVTTHTPPPSLIFAKQIMFFHSMAEAIGMQTWQVPLPSLQIILSQLAFCFVYEDLFHYIGTHGLPNSTTKPDPIPLRNQLTRSFTRPSSTSTFTSCTINTRLHSVSPPNTLILSRRPYWAWVP
jgi:hypothetical protein